MANKFKDTLEKIVNSRFNDDDTYDMDDISINDSDIEITNNTLDYLLFDFEKEISPGHYTRIYKAVKLIKLMRIPKKDLTLGAFLEMQSGVLTGFYQNQINYIQIFANICKPVKKGLIFAYGVQGVSETSMEDAKYQADIMMAALQRGITGTFRTLEYTNLTAEDARWIFRKMKEMKHMNVVRGIPQPKLKQGRASAQTFTATENTNAEEQSEEFLLGMDEYEYIMVLQATTVAPETISKWREAYLKEQTHWASLQKGTKSHTFGVSIPMVYGANLGASQGWGNSQSQSFGENYSTSQSHGWGNNESWSENSSHSISQGESFGTSEGISNSTSLSESVSTGETSGTSTSHSDSISNSLSQSESFSESESKGHSVGTSSNTSVSESISHSDSVSTSESISESTSHSVSKGTSHSTSNSSGWSSGGSESHSTSNNSSISSSGSINVGLPFIGGSGSAGESSGTGTSDSSGTSWSNSGSSGSSHGTSSSISDSTSQSISQGITEGTSDSYSKGTSISNGINESNSTSQGTSQSHGTSVSSGTGSSDGYGTSQSQSQTQSKGTGSSSGTSLGNSYSQSNSESWSTGKGHSTGVSESWSEGSSQGTSKSTSTGVTTSGGTSSGISGSLGLGPSLSFGKTFSWEDREVTTLIDMLQFSLQRIIQASNNLGMWFTDCYIVCESEEAAAASASLAMSSWHSQNTMTSPLQVYRPSPIEREYLTKHLSVFSPSVKKEGIPGQFESYKYSTLLLSNELASMSHPPRANVGGIQAAVDDPPILTIPGKRQNGEIFLGYVGDVEKYSYKMAEYRGGNGYKSEFRYTLRADEIHHAYISGASRSGKTVVARRLVAETYNHVRRGERNKRMRFLIMDPKQDWRALAKVIPPEHFRFYSLADPNFHPIKMNLMKIPKGVYTERYEDKLREIFIRSYGLGDRGFQIFGQAIREVYRDAGCYDGDIKFNQKDSRTGLCPATERSKNCTLEDVCRKLQEYQEHARPEKADAIQRILDRMNDFYEPDSVSYSIFCNRGDGMGIDDLLGEDDVIVLESFGMNTMVSSFIFGLLTTSVYQYAVANKGFVKPKDQYETVIVIEEANQVLIGNDEDNLKGANPFENILDQSAGYGLFIWTLTQKISDMPDSVLANSAIKIIGRQDRKLDIETSIVQIGKDGLIADRVWKNWLPDQPTGWFIIKSTRNRNFTDNAPVHLLVEYMDVEPPTDEELDAILETTKIKKLQKDLFNISETE